MITTYPGRDGTLSNRAVPTGSADRVRKVAREVDALYCANIREGWGFAVAEAYRRWFDLEEEEAVRLYKDYQARF